MFKSLVREEDFDSFLQNNQDKLVLVKFFTTWCGPCQELKKNLSELEKEQPDLVILEVDADRFPTLQYQDQAQKVHQLVVYSVPTIFLFRQGKMVKRGDGGSASVQQLREFISNY
jgi:thioredoxin 1